MFGLGLELSHSYFIWLPSVRYRILSECQNLYLKVLALVNVLVLKTRYSINLTHTFFCRLNHKILPAEFLMRYVFLFESVICLCFLYILDPSCFVSSSFISQQNYSVQTSFGFLALYLHYFIFPHSALINKVQCFIHHSVFSPESPTHQEHVYSGHFSLEIKFSISKHLCYIQCCYFVLF